jgi:glutamyl-tRNA synthetase
MVRTRIPRQVPQDICIVGGLRTASTPICTAVAWRHVHSCHRETDQSGKVPAAGRRFTTLDEPGGSCVRRGPGCGRRLRPYIPNPTRRDIYRSTRGTVERGGAKTCFCTTEELDEARRSEKRGETYKYDKRCLHLPKEESRAASAGGSPRIRQNVPLTGEAGFDDALYGRVAVACSTMDD